jgi:hypothetical protein
MISSVQGFFVMKNNMCKILHLHRETLLPQALDESIQYDFLCNKVKNGLIL